MRLFRSSIGERVTTAPSLLFQVQNTAQQGVSGFDGVKICLQTALRQHLLHECLAEVGIGEFDLHLISARVSKDRRSGGVIFVNDRKDAACRRFDERCSEFLESVRVDVGDVVRDDLELLPEGGQARECGVYGGNHRHLLGAIFYAPSSMVSVGALET